MDGQHICITESEVGEVTFFDMKKGEEVASVCVSGCIDHLLIAHQPDHSTHLLVSVVLCGYVGINVGLGRRSGLAVNALT